VEEVIHEFDPLGKKIMEEDWMEWLKKTSILLLKKSPSELLRGCAVLAEEYNELGL
jgi:phosphatidylinositol kinase/protein kinase (PI-3  family)